ncbi:MAG: PQQ-binding-like beta-propeller repeat protein [Deltaproteobacteria bacterium]|nr:PQQ-binding-like beta-propeller repeat protein [Deltaproteobacteria bacterium]
MKKRNLRDNGGGILRPAKAGLGMTNLFLLLAVLFSIEGCSRFQWINLKEIFIPKATPPWATLHGGPLHWGYMPGEISTPLKLHWVTALSEQNGSILRPQRFTLENSRPTAYNGAIFVGSPTSGLVAIDWSKGKELWRVEDGTGVESTPAIAQDQVLFGAQNGTFYSVDSKTGDENWRLDSGVEILSSPTIAEGKVFFSNARESLYALDLTTGEWLWQVDREVFDKVTIRGTASPAVDAGKVYHSFFDGSVLCLEAQTGNILWETKLPSEGQFTDVDGALLLIPSLHQLVAASFDGHLSGLSLDSGEILWKLESGGSSTAAYDGEWLYWTDREGTLMAIDPSSNGQMVWEKNLHVEFLSAPVVNDSQVLVASDDPEKIFLLDKKTGDILEESWITSGFHQTPTLVDGNILIVSEKGGLYRFRPRYSRATYTTTWE